MKNGVKIIQAADYDGVRTVHDFSTVTLPIYSQFQWMKYFKRCLSFISFLPNMNETLSAKLIMTVLQHQFWVDFGRGKLKTSFLTYNSSKDTKDTLYVLHFDCHNKYFDLM